MDFVTWLRLRASFDTEICPFLLGFIVVTAMTRWYHQHRATRDSTRTNAYSNMPKKAASLVPPRQLKAKGKVTPPATKQPYDAFLVLDVEATCVQGADLNWSNEIIVSLF